MPTRFILPNFKSKVNIKEAKKQREKELAEIQFEKEKIVNLELFDYLCKSSKERKNTFNPKNLKVVYSGNLAEDKCPFIYQLDDLEFDFNVNLYGVGLDGKRIKNKNRHQL